MTAQPISHHEAVTAADVVTAVAGEAVVVTEGTVEAAKLPVPRTGRSTGRGRARSSTSHFLDGRAKTVS